MSSLSLHRLQHARRLGGLAAGTAVCSSALLCETVSDNYRARHKFSTVLSIDGFHSLQKKAKNDDPDDISLNEGRGYFVQDGPFHTFLKECGYVEEVSVTARVRTISLMSGDAEKHL